MHFDFESTYINTNNLKSSLVILHNNKSLQIGIKLMAHFLTVSCVRSAGSRDIFATPLVESFPTKALYGAPFP